MSSERDVEMQQPAGAGASVAPAPASAASNSSSSKDDAPAAAAAADKSLSTGMIILLVVLSPLLLVIAILLGLVWLCLLPFRACMHDHHSSARTQPAESTLLSEDEAMGADRGGFFKSKSSGTWLYHRRWLPVGAAAAGAAPVAPAPAPRGIVFFCHGFGEHISRGGYVQLAAKLTASNFLVLALDHQGHGRSTGDRAWFKSMRLVIEDFEQFVKEQSAQLDSSLPRFIFGHSMGGLIGLNAACDIAIPPTSAAFNSTPLTGLILSSPCLALDPSVATPPLKLAAKVLSNILPKLLLDSLPSSAISRNAQAVSRYDADPLIFRSGLRTRVAAQMMSSMEEVMRRVPEFKLPILLLHGTKDVIVPPAASSRCYSLVGSADKHYSKFEGGFHELFEDEEFSERFFGEINDWLVSHADQVASREKQGHVHELIPAGSAAVVDAPAAASQAAHEEASVNMPPAFHEDAEAKA